MIEAVKSYRFSMPLELTNGVVFAVGLIVAGLVIQWIGEWRDLEVRFGRLWLPIKACTYAAIAALALICGSGELKPFIYFRF